MREYLIILNYQREIPPFMLSQIKYAAQYFKNIFYVTRNLTNDNSAECDADNFTLVQAGSARDGMIGFCAIGGALLHGGIGCLADALCKGRISARFFKSQVQNDVGSFLLYRSASNLIEELGQEHCAVLATWFMSEAYAACLLKRRFPGIQTASFAHSFEVQRLRDPDLDLRHIAERHGGIDAIWFISHKVLEQYREEYMLPFGIPSSNVGVYYLGSEPNEGEGKGYSDDGIFRLVSCSGISQVKRLDLLIDALHDIDEEHAGRLIWTHIGAGPDEDLMKELARERLGHLLGFEFTGYMTNKSVHNYYEEHSCDLFVNVSSMEGLPVSLMESISYGIPAVATNVGGTGEVVVDGLTGKLLPPDPTSKEISNAIEMFMDMPLAKRCKFARDCRRVWAERFDASKNAARLYEALRNSDA